MTAKWKMAKDNPKAAACGMLVLLIIVSIVGIVIWAKWKSVEGDIVEVKSEVDWYTIRTGTFYRKTFTFTIDDGSVIEYQWDEQVDRGSNDVPEVVADYTVGQRIKVAGPKCGGVIQAWEFELVG